MNIQFELPISEKPFVELADRMKIDHNYLIRKIKELKVNGVIKRIGIDLNYKALKDSFGALVGLYVPFGRIFLTAKEINKLNPKHNFWRDHWKYNIWFTVKAENAETLKEKVKTIIDRIQCENHVFLPTERIYRMSVKFDLINGISMSSGRIEPKKVRKLKELGISEDLVRKLVDIDVSERPFYKFKENGYTESEIVDLIVELMKEGIVRDFFATLNERKIGFNVNCMFSAEVKSESDEFIVKVTRKYSQITHMIKRKPSEDWPYNIYFMLHARTKETIEHLGMKIIKDLNAERYEKLYSVMDLKYL